MVCRRMAAAACVVGAVLSSAFSLATDPQRFGGRFEALRVEQQRLVKAWITEFNRATGTSLMAESAYDELSPSTRTTFDAVTHALLTTQLTAQDGTALGTALDLVQLVEAVHGQLADARGDRQSPFCSSTTLFSSETRCISSKNLASLAKAIRHRIIRACFITTKKDEASNSA